MRSFASHLRRWRSGGDRDCRIQSCCGSYSIILFRIPVCSRPMRVDIAFIQQCNRCYIEAVLSSVGDRNFQSTGVAEIRTAFND